MQGIAPDTMIDGRYRIIGRLGSGGMADVYEAEDTQLGRRVALKLLHRRFAEDPEFVERFRREASSAAGLNHPNIVQVFDRGAWDGTYYIAMELLEGRNLKQVVRDHGALDPALAVDIVLQILRAARFAHRRGVVHRDIKPHNVIVDEEGRAKVTDFGIARAGASDMTETGSIMGTAQYLSPEQAQGQPVDARSDLYSIGVVLYELLTGAPPFDADSPVTIALKQVSEEPVPARLRNPAVPPALDMVVMRSLRKERGERFQDADAFAAALESAAAGSYVELEDPVAALEDEDRRNWRRIALTALVVLALLALAIGAWAVLTPAQKKVPNVVGKKSGSAAQILQGAGFEVDVVPIQSDTVPEDRVAGQRPDPGSQADEGSVVTITVSSGPGEAPVPLVQGMTAEEAATALRQGGFKSDERREFSDTVKSGRVIETSPPEGSVARKGTTVTLVVSRGPENVAVPDVVGRPRDEAERTLQDAGLQTSAKEEESADAEPGTVLRQDPGAGSQLAKGKTVSLVVAKAPADVPVPGVIDLPEDDAVRALRDAGFKVKTEETPVDTPDQHGIVVDQDPSLDTPRPKGSTVTITVGRFEPATPELTPTPTPTPTPTVAP
ncbi:MAG TPA: PASTA domain-containing protein [Solirubrobacteraceae bacterium]|nr:PASTA domain-containing protein [Solirubrobacteraceae bacterium]